MSRRADAVRGDPRSMTAVPDTPGCPESILIVDFGSQVHPAHRAPPARTRGLQRDPALHRRPRGPSTLPSPRHRALRRAGERLRRRRSGGAGGTPRRRRPGPRRLLRHAAPRPRLRRRCPAGRTTVLRAGRLSPRRFRAAVPRGPAAIPGVGQPRGPGPRPARGLPPHRRDDAKRPRGLRAPGPGAVRRPVSPGSGPHRARRAHSGELRLRGLRSARRLVAEVPRRARHRRHPAHRR